MMKVYSLPAVVRVQLALDPEFSFSPMHSIRYVIDLHMQNTVRLLLSPSLPVCSAAASAYDTQPAARSCGARSALSSSTGRCLKPLASGW